MTLACRAGWLAWAGFIGWVVMHGTLKALG